MKLHLWKVVLMAMMLSVSGVLVSAMSPVETGSFSFRVDVPFDFQIGEEKFAAGEYQFKQLEQYLLAVEGIGSESDGYALGGTSVDVVGEYDEYRITFHTYGDVNFLRAVSTPSVTFALGESESENSIRDSGKATLKKRIVKY